MKFATIAGLIPYVPTLPAQRVRRGLWSPPMPVGPYKLPPDVQERLTVALRDFRNREAALALAVFLGRYWSTPARLVLAFPIDRRALTDHAVLGLTEARVRGAIATLENIGFIDRETPQGSRYRATDAGLHRKPVLYRFGSGYREAFDKANTRSRISRGGMAPARRHITAPLVMAQPVLSTSKVAQKEKLPGKGLIMGEQRSSPDASSPLELALAKLMEGVFEGRGENG